MLKPGNVINNNSVSFECIQADCLMYGARKVTWSIFFPSRYYLEATLYHLISTRYYLVPSRYYLFWIRYYHEVNRDYFVGRRYYLVTSRYFPVTFHIDPNSKIITADTNYSHNWMSRYKSWGSHWTIIVLLRCPFENKQTNERTINNQKQTNKQTKQNKTILTSFRIFLISSSLS